MYVCGCDLMNWYYLLSDVASFPRNFRSLSLDFHDACKIHPCPVTGGREA